MYYIPKILNRLKFTSKKNCNISKKSKILGGCSLQCVSVGKYTYIGSNSIIVNAEIGAFCSIAGGCMIGGGSHPLAFVSTSPVFHSGKNCLKKNFSNILYNPYQKTIIGNDVWIGARCLIKSGISIGTGAVIGMGSVVTHDVPPYEVWAGNPARCIKKRFSNDICDALLKSEWWNYSERELKQYGELFNNPNKLIAALKEK